MIGEAREFGIKLILTLTDSRGDYGGMPAYVRSVYGEEGTITDFYTNEAVRVRTQWADAGRIFQLQYVCDSCEPQLSAPSVRNSGLIIITTLLRRAYQLHSTTDLSFV